MDIKQIKSFCLEEIYRQRTVLFNECVMYGQTAYSQGEKIELRPITYIDLPISSPRFLKAVNQYIISLRDEIYYKSVCGVATQGLPYSYSVSLMNGIPSIYYRKEKQKYGTNSYLSGILTKNDCPTLIVDNLIYSGQTIEMASIELEANDIPIAGICAVVDFSTSINRITSKYPIYSLLDVKEIYDYLIQRNYFPKEINTYIVKFIKDQTLFHKNSEDYLKYVSLLDKGI